MKGIINIEGATPIQSVRSHARNSRNYPIDSNNSGKLSLRTRTRTDKPVRPIISTSKSSVPSTQYVTDLGINFNGNGFIKEGSSSSNTKKLSNGSIAFVNGTYNTFDEDDVDDDYTRGPRRNEDDFSAIEDDILSPDPYFVNTIDHNASDNYVNNTKHSEEIPKHDNGLSINRNDSFFACNRTRANPADYDFVRGRNIFSSDSYSLLNTTNHSLEPSVELIEIEEQYSNHVENDELYPITKHDPFENNIATSLNQDSRKTSSTHLFANGSFHDYDQTFETSKLNNDFHQKRNGNISYSVDPIVTSKMISETNSPEDPFDIETVSPKQSPRRLSRRTRDPDHVSHQFFHLEPCLYTHRMFQRAARIFAVLKHDDADTEEKKALRRRNGEVDPVKPKIPDMDFLDAHEQIKTFELTFATLKFQKLFSHILDHIGFFNKFSELNDHYSLVYVVMHDLQTRKFQRRIPFPNEVLDRDCVRVEEAILGEKTKLQANIAKERIKHNAPSVDFLLPEHIRNKDETKAKTPVYMWVNQMKTTLENVTANLKSDNFQPLPVGTDMSEVAEAAFVIDPHCPDVLTFPPHMNMELKQSEMVRAGLLVQQDKSSCLAPQTVAHILANDNDCIHVNIGTGMSTCHLASLLRNKSPSSHIWAFGVQDPQKTSNLLRTIEDLEAKNVKVASEDFLSTDPEESKFKGVRVILISANCSKSAITSPVQFVVSEGEDTQILGELSVVEADMSHVRDLMVDHERLLKHALKFPKVQAVVYTTRSRFELENELVVERVLEAMNATNNKRNLFKVAPPVIPFSSDEIDSGQSGVDGRYVRFLPSDKANGCFVAIIAREPDEPKDNRMEKLKSKSKLGKSKSAQANSFTDKPKKNLKTAHSLSEMNGANGVLDEETDHGDSANSKTIKSRSTSTTGVQKRQHKSSTIGARLHQDGTQKNAEKPKGPPVPPEHLKVVRHPAPFSRCGQVVHNMP